MHTLKAFSMSARVSTYQALCVLAVVSADERVSACVCNHQELSAHLLVTRAERESACVRVLSWRAKRESARVCVCVRARASSVIES
jgi:hypothetical protein